MPHQCTDCGRTFADGSKEMLSGCPACGGNKFQFLPAGADTASDPPEATEEPPEPPEPTGGSSVSRTVGSAAAAVRDFVGSGGSPNSSSPSASDFDREEDAAQADARSEVVGPEDLPPIPERDGSARPDDGQADTGRTTADASARPAAAVDTEPSDPDMPVSPGTAADHEPSDGTDGKESVDASAADQPDLAQLRAELNDQFESIRVVAPGQYELNLMELYDREEYIIALQEDGRYTIQVPETWRD